jgi:hypothetical protein
METQNQTQIVDRSAIIKMVRDMNEGDQFSLLVTGTSMMPFLFDRKSVVYLEKCTQYKGQKGDIILFFRLDGSVVLHRVRDTSDPLQIMVNGDAQDWTENIFPTQVMARVTAIQRRKRVFSVENKWYRFWVAVWRPLLPLHPVGARLVHIWHRIPEKIFGIHKK